MKSAERNLLDEATLRHNQDSIKKQVLAVVRLRGEVVRDVDCLPDEVRRVADFASVLSSECDVADRDELLLSADAPFFSSAIPPIVYG